MTKYKNKLEFSKVQVDMGFLSWNNGEMEFAEKTLYQWN